MTFLILKTLNSLLKLLNSETAPSQLAAGLAFGMIVGLTPLMSLHNLVFFLIVCLFRVNFSMFFLSLGIFKILAYLFDPFFDWFGYFLLVDLKGLREFWIQIQTGAIWPFFKFYNTVVLGSLASSLLLWIPIFLTGIILVSVYRKKYRQQIANSKFMKALKATPLYGFYQKFESAREKLSVIK